MKGLKPIKKYGPNKSLEPIGNKEALPLAQLSVGFKMMEVSDGR